MILNTKKVFHEESGWEKIENRVRTWIYTLMHELLQSQITTPTLYKILLILEAFQFFWYSIHGDFDFLWTVDVSDWLREMVKYLQFDDLLHRESKSFFVVCLYIVFGIQVVIFLMALFTTLRLTNTHKKTSTILAYSLKILSIYGLLLNTVFVLPFFNIFIAALFCKSDDRIHGDLTCYQGVYFAHLVVAIIGLIILFFTAVLFNMLYIDLNPCSVIPFAAPQSRLNLLRLALKIALAIYATVDVNRDAGKTFIALYGIVWLLILVLRYRQTPYYNTSVFKFAIGIDAIIFWSAVVGNIEAFIDTDQRDETGLFYLFLGAFFVAYGFITLTGRRSSHYRKLHLKNFKKDIDVEMYVNVIFNLIENRDKPQCRMALEGLLKYYVRQSSKKETDSVAYTLARDLFREEEAPEKLWYTWVKEILVDALDKFPKSSRLHMLYAYIQREKLHNKFKALFEMMITEDNKPSVEEEFSIYRYKNIIEEEMIENDARNSETKGVDVNIIVYFQNKFVEFQAIIEKAVELHLDFWRELLEANPDIQKLQGLGSHITHSVEETAEQFRRLNDINPNHIKMLQIYGNFLKDIVNDENEALRVIEKADYVDKSSSVNKQFIDNDRLKYGENSNTCIITCSGNFNSMGIVTNVNNEINRILNFQKNELINSNVSKIMPKAIADLHDGFMRNYFETSEAKVIGIERVVFPVNKSGYVVPCTLMIKVLPNLDEGIRMVGFLKDIEKDSSVMKNAEFDSDEKVHYILYSGDTGVIHGITYSCKQEFGIPSSLVHGSNSATNEFTIDTIFPELLTHNIEELKGATGVTTTLDTSTLQQNYLIAQGRDDESNYEDDLSEDRERKYRKCKVRAIMIQDDDYADTNVKILKFIELKDGQDFEFKKESSLRQTAKEDDEKKDVTVEKGEEGEHGKHEGNEDVSGQLEEKQSEGGSSVSAGDTVNEDMRTLKDFKTMISEKTTPKSIKVLSRAVILIFILLIVLTSVDLSLKFNQIGEFKEGIQTINQAYRRHNIMAEINYRIRLLHQLALNKDLGNPDITNITLKARLIELISNLATVQYDIMKSGETLKSKGATTVDSQDIPLETQTDTVPKIEQRVYTDSIFQYITAASSLRNATSDELSSTSNTETVPKNFFFVRRNGLGPLRSGSERAAQSFYDFYVERAKKFDKKFLGVMIAGILLLFLSELILIPIVFSVHRTNNRVLSLFGFIPLGEITELAAKCEHYMDTYLEDHREKKEYSYEGSEDEQDQTNRSGQVDNSYLEVSQHENQEGDVSVADDQAPNKLDNSERVEVKAFIGPKTTPQNGADKSKLLTPDSVKLQSDHSASPLVINEPAKSVTKLKDEKRVSPMDKKITPNHKEDKNQDAEMDIDLANERSQKLLNSRDNRRSKVILQFTIITLLFVAYFVGDYLHEISVTSDIKTGLLHLKLIGERMPHIRYVVAYTLEEISETDLDDVYLYSDTGYVDLRAQYFTLVSEIEKQIRDSSKDDFPGAFNSYLNQFNLYNNQDLCSSFYSYRQAECEAVAQGLLAKGLSVSATTVSLNTDDVLKSMYAGTSRDDSLKADKMVASEYTLDEIMPAMEALNESYLSAFKDFLNNTLNIERVKFSIFIIFCFFVFGILWLRYLKSLNDKIFRTKGMLNMIPMDIITKNESLKNLFVSGDILQAVK